MQRQTEAQRTSDLEARARRPRWLGGCLSATAALLVLMTGLIGLSGWLRDRGIDLPFNRPAPAISGRVITSAGKPIDPAVARVHLKIHSFMDGKDYAPLLGPTGTYEARIPEGRCSAEAWAELPMNGKIVSLRLHPMNAIVGEENCIRGFQKDFFWPLTGIKADGNPNNPADHYGRVVIAFLTDPAVDDAARISLHFHPRTPNLDGTAGHDQTLEVSASSLRSNGRVGEVAVADYDVTADLVLTDGSTRPLLIDGQPQNDLALRRDATAATPVTVQLSLSAAPPGSPAAAR